jgi:prepilin-type N-terminal cleavage/methylation domain-containing protein
MSTVDATRAGGRARRSEAGFTALEIMVTLIIIGVMATIVEHTLGSAHRAERQLSAVRRVTERCEKVAYEILDEVNRSRKLFQGDATGQAYLDALDLTRDPLLATARLPVFEEGNRMLADLAGEPRTGNILFFVSEAPAAEAVADAGTGKKRAIDLHRFICIYPRQTTRVLVSGSQMLPARDLVVWRSALFPSHAQILAIEDDDERTSVIRDLVERWGCDHAWASNSELDEAFYALGSLGGISPTPLASPVIDEDLDASERGRLVYADLQLARSMPNEYYRRNRFTVDDPAVWSPDGLEVKVVGISGARKVWYRLTAESPATKDVVGVQGCEMTASPRDM